MSRYTRGKKARWRRYDLAWRRYFRHIRKLGPVRRGTPFIVPLMPAMHRDYIAQVHAAYSGCYTTVDRHR